jgi:uncharacterized membrane protein YcaP (DUF421 family)
MFFHSWSGILQVALSAVLIYIVLIVLLRTSGKRTLSKMNMFDFIITIALGSTFASIITSKSLALIEGIVAVVLLIYMQYAVSWLAVRFKSFQELIKGHPRLLYYNNEFIEKALKDERVSKEDVYMVIRSSGYATLEEVYAVVLETDGSLSTIPVSEAEVNTIHPIEKEQQVPNLR